MRHCRRALLGVSLIIAGAPSAYSLDMAKATCRGFLASGQDNMAAVIMWLRGFHAGKSGLIVTTDAAQMRAYGGRLGRYCKEHPDTRVIDASEQILSEEDHGI